MRKRGRRWCSKALGMHRLSMTFHGSHETTGNEDPMSMENQKAGNLQGSWALETPSQSSVATGECRPHVPELIFKGSYKSE